MAVRKLWTVRFRTSPDEYVFTHAVPVMLSFEGSEKPEMWFPALCGKVVPENMQESPESFNMFINVHQADCVGCAEVAMADIRRSMPSEPVKLSLRRRNRVA